MANFTKQAIKHTFLELLKTKSIGEITVKMIVENCGINRKTFYYHYRDMPDLIEEVCAELADEFAQQYKSFDSIDDCISVVTDFVLSKKKLLYRSYYAPNRERFDDLLLKISEHMVRSLITELAKKYPISHSEQEGLILWYRGLYFGLIIEWLHDGMNEDHLSSFRDACLIHHNMLEQMLQKKAQPS